MRGGRGISPYFKKGKSDNEPYIRSDIVITTVGGRGGYTYCGGEKGRFLTSDNRLRLFGGETAAGSEKKNLVGGAAKKEKSS